MRTRNSKTVMISKELNSLSFLLQQFLVFFFFEEQQITLKHQPKQMLSVKACNGHFFRVLKYKATAAAAKRNLTKWSIFQKSKSDVRTDH